MQLAGQNSEDFFQGILLGTLFQKPENLVQILRNFLKILLIGPNPGVTKGQVHSKAATKSSDAGIIYQFIFVSAIFAYEYLFRIGLVIICDCKSPAASEKPCRLRHYWLMYQVFGSYSYLR